MSVLHVLLPPFAQLRDAPAWQHWLLRGDRLADIARPRASVARECFRFAADAVPAAALRHHCHATDAGAGTWVCADPAYVRSEATGARLMSWPIVDLGEREASDLADAVRGLFADSAMQLCVDTPSEWCLRCPPGAASAAFVPPGAALGASLLDCLPQGDAGRAWRRWFNEAQVILHAHPVNAARVAAGKLPVNALWFWGAGALPDTVESGLQQLASTDDVLRGLAKMAGVMRLEPLQEALDNAEGNGDALLDLDPLGARETIAAWHGAFEKWLRTRRFDAIVLTFASGERWRVRHVHRLRFWRRA